MKYYVLGFMGGSSLISLATTPNMAIMLGATTAFIVSIFLLAIKVHLDRKERLMSEFDRAMYNREAEQRRKTSMLMSGKWSTF